MLNNVKPKESGNITFQPRFINDHTYNEVKSPLFIQKKT